MAVPRAIVPGRRTSAARELTGRRRGYDKDAKATPFGGRAKNCTVITGTVRYSNHIMKTVESTMALVRKYRRVD